MKCRKKTNTECDKLRKDIQDINVNIADEDLSISNLSDIIDTLQVEKERLQDRNKLLTGSVNISNQDLLEAN